MQVMHVLLATATTPHAASRSRSLEVNGALQPAAGGAGQRTRVALCIAGQFRDHFQLVYPRLRDFLFNDDALDIDVFITTWEEVGEEDAHGAVKTQDRKYHHGPAQTNSPLQQRATGSCGISTFNRLSSRLTSAVIVISTCACPLISLTKRQTVSNLCASLRRACTGSSKLAAST